MDSKKKPIAFNGFSYSILHENKESDTYRCSSRRKGCKAKLTVQFRVQKLVPKGVHTCIKIVELKVEKNEEDCIDESRSFVSDYAINCLDLRKTAIYNEMIRNLGEKYATDVILTETRTNVFSIVETGNGSLSSPVSRHTTDLESKRISPNRIGNLESMMVDVKKDMNDMKKDMNDMKKDMNDVKKDMNDLKEGVNDIRQMLETLVQSKSN
jgi:hypothetical protein